MGKVLQSSKPLQLNRIVTHFRKDALPPARSFYEYELGKLTRPNRKGWALGPCPFHDTKSGNSFSVNLEHGAFYCFGCDAKGGDLISFLRLRDGLSFKQACERLGAWDESGKPIKVRPGPPVRYLVMEFTIDGVEYRASVPDEPTTELRQLRRFHVAAHDRLIEIRNDGGADDGDEEVQWGILASSWALIQMEVTGGAR